MKTLITYLIVIQSLLLSAHAYSSGQQHQWFETTSDILIEHRQDALTFYHQSRYQDSFDTFTEGIRLALRSEPRSTRSSMSYKWLYRTLNMLDGINREGAQDQKDLRVLNLFLDESYRYLIDFSLRFDHQHYLISHGYRHPSVRSMEKSYIEDSFRYMDQMLESFIVKDYRGRVFPFGSTKVTKRVLELISHFGSDDLGESFMSRFYRCERGVLMRASRNLSQIPLPSVEIYHLTSAYGQIRSVIEGYACY